MWRASRRSLAQRAAPYPPPRATRSACRLACWCVFCRKKDSTAAPPAPPQCSAVVLHHGVAIGTRATLLFCFGVGAGWGSKSALLTHHQRSTPAKYAAHVAPLKPSRHHPRACRSPECAKLRFSAVVCLPLLDGCGPRARAQTSSSLLPAHLAQAAGEGDADDGDQIHDSPHLLLDAASAPEAACSRKTAGVLIVTVVLLLGSVLVCTPSVSVLGAIGVRGKTKGGSQGVAHHEAALIHAPCRHCDADRFGAGRQGQTGAARRGGPHYGCAVVGHRGGATASHIAGEPDCASYPPAAL